MKQNFKEQFLSLRKIIETNVSTLQELIKQSENLSSLIQQLKPEHESTLKAQLGDSREKINASIRSLATQTQDLFKVYENLVDEVFGK